MRFVDMMVQEYENLQMIIKRCNRTLQHLPRGVLSPEEKNGHIYYNKYADGAVTYIRSDSKEIIQLKDRHLAEEVLINAEHNMQLMRSIVNGYKEYDPNQLVKSFAAAYQGVSKDVVLSMGFPYTLGYAGISQDGSKHQENLKYITTKGTRRRSKSELIIDGIYEMLGIQVAYEKPLKLASGYVINPDYTTWVELERREKYHEHIGDLIDPEKRRINVWKIQQYVDSGIYPLDRVLFTFDKPDGSIDAELITMLIKAIMQ